MNKTELWIGGYGPMESSHGRGLAAFRDAVEEATAGEVLVRITWNIMNTGRKNTDLLELVESGEMFMCYFSSTYLGDRIPALNVLETPFLFDDVASAHRALDADLGERLAEETRQSTELDVLGFWDNGIRHLTNRVRPVLKPSDCEGMTVRVQPNAIHEELIRSWGAEPVPTELSGGIRLLLNGNIDAQENPLANTVAYGIADAHHHLTMTGHLYGARGLWVGKESLRRLPEEIADVVRGAAASAIDAQRAQASSAEQVYRTQLEAQGVAIVDLDAAQRSEFKERSARAVTLAERGVAPDLLRLLGTRD